MKFYLRKIGFTLTVIAVVLALFDFLLENNLVILILGLAAILVSKIIK
jgi:heme/copper-type cytochrome/quinol oxidase subunit 4